MVVSEFAASMAQFIQHLRVEKGLAKNTVISYMLDLRQLLEFWQQLDATVATNTPLLTALDKYFMLLYKNKCTNSTIARKVSCLRSFERFMERQGQLLNLQLARPTIEKRLPVFLTVDQMFALLDQVKPEDLPTQHPLRDIAILELLYATGIRVAELTNIKCHEIDMQNKTILIQGKGRQQRIALFGAKAAEKINNYLQQERPPLVTATDPLFVNNRHEQLSSRAVQRTIKRFSGFLQIARPITPHKIRHTFATHLLAQGVDLRVVQELLGHRSLSSTEKYTHVTATQLQKLCNEIHPLMHKKDDDQ
ncbi:tyrosine-type recombinase/integrase [Candidatus Dependentiae bacterium]|nr:tyrosine-type recombinase/integrase [Candidatus Dependentiae bacterium]